AVVRPTARVLTRRGWSLAGAALGLALAGRLLGTVELWILTTGIALLLVMSMLWARTRRLDVVAERTIRPARLYVGGQGPDALGPRPVCRVPTFPATAVAPRCACPPRCRQARPRRRRTACRRTAAAGSTSVRSRCRRPTPSVWLAGRGRSRLPATSSCARVST